MSRFSLRARTAVALMILILGVLLGATGIVSAVYIQRSDASVVRVLAGWLPAARVGSDYIAYREFIASRDALRVYLASDAAKSAGLSGPVNAMVEKNALERLTREVAAQEIAAERKVSVSDEDIAVAFADLLAKTSSTVPNVGEYLQTTFHWSEEQFRARVIRPALLEEKLAATFPAKESSPENGVEPYPGFVELEKYLQERLAKPDVKTYLRF